MSQALWNNSPLSDGNHYEWVEVTQSETDDENETGQSEEQNTKSDNVSVNTDNHDTPHGLASQFTTPMPVPLKPQLRHSQHPRRHLADQSHVCHAARLFPVKLFSHGTLSQQERLLHQNEEESHMARRPFHHSHRLITVRIERDVEKEEFVRTAEGKEKAESVQRLRRQAAHISRSGSPHGVILPACEHDTRTVQRRPVQQADRRAILMRKRSRCYISYSRRFWRSHTRNSSFTLLLNSDKSHNVSERQPSSHSLQSHVLTLPSYLSIPDPFTTDSTIPYPVSLVDDSFFVATSNSLTHSLPTHTSVTPRSPTHQSPHTPKILQDAAAMEAECLQRVEMETVLGEREGLFDPSQHDHVEYITRVADIHSSSSGKVNIEGTSFSSCSSSGGGVLFVSSGSDAVSSDLVIQASSDAGCVCGGEHEGIADPKSCFEWTSEEQGRVSRPQ
ncbi:hypothetical protein BLNAU_19771 [Blattamonas nauphoetae]|uniref:Uncharacterized protein n=1 Tax=Blattamonas nauphoetae TaxID=2049346 RepID=A0ABQ9X182_9EUKA|nr:hypothetical protein BLNAU_19771 [Blattamonas nauphoetae]